MRGEDPQIAAAAQVIAHAAPDVLLLTGIDYDHGLAALGAFRDRIAEAGHAFPHLFARRPNTGMATGLDLDGDGRLGGPGDAQGWGRFAGAGGMALLSRHPIDGSAARDLSDLLWAEVPGALVPDAMPGDHRAVRRLSTTGHWIVPVRPAAGPLLVIMAFSATPPVFDGPEDMNGRRNHDEILLWRHVMDGAFGPAPDARFVILGNANLDPVDGEGRHAAIRALLDDPRLQDARPGSEGGRAAASPGHAGDPARDTADWREPAPGNLRVDYVLPSADWEVTAAGVLWPDDGPLAETVARASRHRLVWVDLAPLDPVEASE
ncbi:endonuclease/exonuclease/phosphatase family protein [Rhodosalinus sp. FB01]|uniref:endonuclease/exonuclease/phosphatase family protein n=1 Tax=Rhodosalinus sp. FB01 TaxID=3239194 RepID=UPI0035261426